MGEFEDIVIYCDNHLLVVSKPAGVPSQPDTSGDPDLLSLAKDYLKLRFDRPGQVFLGLVHRLDRPVSGVMVFARTSKAASRLSLQFRRREVDKRYVALVEGRTQDAGVATGFVRKSHRGVRAATEDESGSVYAELAWTKVADVADSSILDIRLITGRKHQIRHQLSRLGHPIRGDIRYGASAAFDGRNLALHCYLLAIEHPTQRRRMSWKAAPPLAWGDAGRVVARWMSSEDRSS